MWRRLGRLFVAEGQRPWMTSHTAVPIPRPLGGPRVRFYFATRDAANHAAVAWLDARVTPDGAEVEALSEEPALGAGPPGHFDDNGVYPGPVVERDGELCMYYVGRSNSTPPLYYMAIGLAASSDGGATFERAYRAPIMGRSEVDPWMVSTPCVLREPGGWRMWYLSGTGWDLDADPPRAFYDIKHAESTDGIAWRRDGRAAIGLGADTTNVSVPTVERASGGYRMWFSFIAPGHGYRIGYAESSDGLSWERRDRSGGLEPSGSGWDSDEVAYPGAFRLDGRLYLAYSGNGFGRDGFGIAVAESGPWARTTA
jgi:hypothetical protein